VFCTRIVIVLSAVNTSSSPRILQYDISYEVLTISSAGLLFLRMSSFNLRSLLQFLFRSSNPPSQFSAQFNLCLILRLSRNQDGLFTFLLLSL
jgi:hypothetical protein